MDLIKVFKDLNLKEEHLKVYLANLEWGETIITNIARKSKLPRTTIYLLIKDLLDLGLISKTMKSNQTYYIASGPEYIKTLLETKVKDISFSIKNLEASLNELKAISNANPKKPKVEFLEGAEGIKLAYTRSLNDEPKRIDIQCFTQDYGNVVGEDFFKKYFKQFFSSKTKSRELLSDDEAYIKKYGKENKLQLLVDNKDEKIETDLWVYENKVTFVSFNKENPYALIIEDANISKAIKSLYELAWKEASKEDKRVKEGKNVQVEFND